MYVSLYRSSNEIAYMGISYSIFAKHEPCELLMNPYIVDPLLTAHIWYYDYSTLYIKIVCVCYLVMSTYIQLKNSHENEHLFKMKNQYQMFLQHPIPRPPISNYPFFQSLLIWDKYLYNLP